MSWGWRKLLQIRPLARHHFYYKLGNGLTASAWHDIWGNHCPLIDSVSPRMINSAGFNLSSKVADIIQDGAWKWPMNWNARFPNSIVPSLVNHRDDVVCWKDRRGELTVFSVGLAWDDLRPRDALVEWYHLVWFTHCIPKHSFLLWLAVRKKLKTQDMLRQWDLQHLPPTTVLLCPLCELQSDSHGHLFFECHFAKQVWIDVNKKAGLQQQPVIWDDIIQDMLPYAKKNSISNVVSKLIFAASVYFIWQERNARLFNKKKRTKEQLVEVVFHTIRLKLLTFRYKKNDRVEKAMATWKLPKALLKN